MLINGIVASDTLYGTSVTTTENVIVDQDGNYIIASTGARIEYQDSTDPISFSPNRVPTDTNYGRYIDDAHIEIIGLSDTRSTQYMGEIPIPYSRIYLEFVVSNSGDGSPSADPIDVIAGIATHPRSPTTYIQTGVYSDLLVNRYEDTSEFDLPNYDGYPTDPTGMTDLGVVYVSLGEFRSVVNNPGSQWDEVWDLPSTPPVLDYSTGNVIMIAIDLVEGFINIGSNGNWRGESAYPGTWDISDSSTADFFPAPEIEWDSTDVLAANWYPVIHHVAHSTRTGGAYNYTVEMRGGSIPTTYTVPSGYNV